MWDQRGGSAPRAKLDTGGTHSVNSLQLSDDTHLLLAGTSTGQVSPAVPDLWHHSIWLHKHQLECWSNRHVADELQLLTTYVRLSGFSLPLPAKGLPCLAV